MDRQRVIDEFHKLYYPVCGRNNWLGYQVLKCPMDLMAYQQLIYLTRPDVIIETGTYAGGSALFIATVCDAIDHGYVISIDIQNDRFKDLLPKHQRITWLSGSSLDVDVHKDVQHLTRGWQGMVVLDSNHEADHVYQEMVAYASYVAKGCYMIVEDTNIGGRPVVPECKAGPYQAVEKFLKGNHDFLWDQAFEANLELTFNPGGYLKRTGIRPPVEFTKIDNRI